MLLLVRWVLELRGGRGNSHGMYNLNLVLVCGIDERTETISALCDLYLDLTTDEELCSKYIDLLHYVIV